MRSEGATRRRVGARGLVLLGIAASGVLACAWLGLGPAGLVPRGGGPSLLADFLSAALRPALRHPGPVPPGTAPLLVQVVQAVGRTLAFALAAMGLSLVLGLPLACLASDAFWSEVARGRSPWLARAVQVATRVAIALLRSVHELLWAVVFLAALGLNTAAAVMALTLPFAGTLAKVFSEVIDEAPGRAATALRGLGARSLAVFGLGRLPFALPDGAAYAFYRFECAVRSAAVLGFFGYPTLGYHLNLAFGDVRYEEVWTYLYALLALVLAFEAWSAALRRRFVA